MRFGKSKRNTQPKKTQPKPPPPTQQQNNGGNSIMGNVIGGVASGIGVGTGIEASRQVMGSIFGNSNEKKTDVEQQNVNNINCNLLMDLIKDCKDNNSMYDYNCNGLIKSFEKHCS